MPIDHERTERELRRALADALGQSRGEDRRKGAISVGNLNMHGSSSSGDWRAATIAVAAAVVAVIAAVIALVHG